MEGLSYSAEILAGCPAATGAVIAAVLEIHFANLHPLIGIPTKREVTKRDDLRHPCLASHSSVVLARHHEEASLCAAPKNSDLLGVSVSARPLGFPATA
jgi:hypothetical protein